MVVKRLPDNELCHHGIIGQKWGVRRFQNNDGTLTNEGRKRKGLVQTIKDKRKAKMLREARERKKAEREEKEEIIRSGDRALIRKNKKRLTDEELARAIARVNMNDSLSDYTTGGSKQSQAERAMQMVDRISKVAATVGTIASTANSIGTAARTFNTLKTEKSNTSAYLKSLQQQSEILKAKQNIAESTQKATEAKHLIGNMKAGDYSHMSKKEEKKEEKKSSS